MNILRFAALAALFSAVGCGVAEPQPAGPHQDLRAIYEAAGLRVQGQIPYMKDECADPGPAHVEVSTIALGGDVGDGTLVTISSTACFGDAGAALELLRRNSAGAYSSILSETGAGVSALKTTHLGAADVAIDSPEGTPTYQWTGARYQRVRR